MQSVLTAQVTYCVTNTYCVTKTFLPSFLPTYLLSYFLTHLISYFLTAWSRVLSENRTGSQQVKKFPSFYGTRRFYTAFTSARHPSLSWASSIQSVPSHSTSWRSILVLSWVFQVVSFFRVSPPKPCMHLSCPPYVLRAPPISFSMLSPAQYLVSSTDR